MVPITPADGRAPASAAPTIWRLVTPAAEPIVEMHGGADDLHVYCIHSVTGDVSGLDGFASRFGRFRLQGIQVPKRDMTPRLAAAIETLAAHHVTLLEAHQPQGAIRLVGWSAGAIVALEMAQQLRSRGREVPLLVALDGAPCNTGAGLRGRDPRYLAAVLLNLPRWIRDDRSSDWSWSGIRRRITEKLAIWRGPGKLAHWDTLDASAVENVIARPGWSPTQKAFVQTIYAAMAAYRPQPYAGKTLVFETRTQPLFHLRQVGAAWRAVAEDCEIVPVRGNHSQLIHEPTASWLAAELVSRLDA